MFKSSDDDDRAAERIVEINSRIHESSALYMNLVMLAGYAGAFAIWSYTREQLPPRASIGVALCLTISLTSFVLFEIYKMVRMSRSIIEFRDLLGQNLSARDFLAKANKIEAERHTTFRKVLLNAWRFSFLLSVLTGLSAVVILTYNFLSILLWK